MTRPGFTNSDRILKRHKERLQLPREKPKTPGTSVSPGVPRVSKFGHAAPPPTSALRETQRERELHAVFTSAKLGNRRRKPSMPPLPAHWASDAHDEETSS